MIIQNETSWYKTHFWWNLAGKVHSFGLYFHAEQHKAFTPVKFCLNLIKHQWILQIKLVLISFDLCASVNERNAWRTMQRLRMGLSHRRLTDLHLHHLLHVQGTSKPSETSGCFLFSVVFRRGWRWGYGHSEILPVSWWQELVTRDSTIVLLQEGKPALVSCLVSLTNSWPDGHRNSWQWTVTQCILFSLGTTLSVPAWVQS